MKDEMKEKHEVLGDRLSSTKDLDDIDKNNKHMDGKGETGYFAKEVYFYQEVSAILSCYGFYTLWVAGNKYLDDESEEEDHVDFIVRSLDKGEQKEIKVQMKSSGIAVQKDYYDRDIKRKDDPLWIAFPVGDQWYLIKHMDLWNKLGDYKPRGNDDLQKRNQGTRLCPEKLEQIDAALGESPGHMKKWLKDWCIGSLEGTRLEDNA